jgi:hypothetical protein
MTRLKEKRKISLKKGKVKKGKVKNHKMILNASTAVNKGII